MALRSSAASLIGCLAAAGGREGAIAGLLRPALLLVQQDASSSSSSISWPNCSTSGCSASPASLCSSRGYARSSKGSPSARAESTAPSTSATTGTAKIVLLQVRIKGRRGNVGEGDHAAHAACMEAGRLMEFLLAALCMQAIPGVGAKGSVVEANAGWMRHVLFPQKKAVYATPENVEAFSMVSS
jgi:hypothetical protein